MTNNRADGLPNTVRSPKFGCQSAVEGNQFKWWWQMGKVDVDLIVNWKSQVGVFSGSDRI